MYSKNKLLDISGKCYLMVDKITINEADNSNNAEELILLEEFGLPQRLFAVKEKHIGNEFNAYREEISDQPLTQRAYRHWRGNLYYLKNIVTFIEDNTLVVLLQELFGKNRIILKPLSNFLELVPEEYRGHGVTNQTYKFEIFEGVQLYSDDVEKIDIEIEEE